MRIRVAVAVACLSAIGLAAAHDVAAAIRRTTNIPAQGLGPALQTLAKERGFQIVYVSDEVNALRTEGASGELTAVEALEQILRGTGLTYRSFGENAVSIVSAAGAPQTPETTSGVSESNETVLTEVIVTAQRRGQNVLDVPMSITVLGNQQLERAGMATLEAVAHSTPSLTVLETGSGGSMYTMRGVGNIAGTSALVGIYLDEIGLAKGGLEGQLHMPLFDLDRIEVLKGPQGTLYGEGSVGGTIRLISNDPQFDGVDGMLDLSQSFTEDGDPSRMIRGVVNLPVLDEVLGFRIATVYEDLGGWIDIPAEAREDVNGSELINVRVKGLWRPTDKLEIEGTIVVSDRDNDSTPTGTDENYHITTIFPNQDLSGGDGYEIYNLTATYDFGAFDLLSASSYVEDDSSRTLNQFIRLAVFPPTFPPLGLITENDGDSETFTQEVRLNSNGDGPFSWDVGAYYRDLTRSLDSVSTLTFDGVVAGATPTNFESSSRSSAVFTNVSYALNERLELGAGLRYFYDDVEMVRPPNAASPDRTVDRETFDALTPRVYASYDLGASTMIYLNVAKGFRSGGFNQTGVPPYEPEDLISYDAGIKGQFFDRAVVAELAAFLSEYKKAQTVAVLVTDAGNLAQRIANVGEAEIKGVEAAVTWNVTGALSLGLNGSVIDTEVTSLQGATSASHAVGDPLDLVPDYTFNVSGTYELDWLDSVPGYVRVDYSELGKSTTTNLGSGLIPPRGESDIINLLSARAHAAWSGWYVEIFGENLLNESGNSNSWNFIDQNIRPRPRTVGLRLGKSFN